jgi:DNA ligase 4
VADRFRYPNRPHNCSKTLAFHELFTTLFNPLNDNKKKPTGPPVARAKQGPHGLLNPSPHEARRLIIERFISRWRNEVGNDFYPALRLIIPEKDRDRAMYGLKEKAIGKLLVRLMKIDKNSEDGHNLLNWKLPGQTVASRMAGDFAGRCFEVLSKRPMRTSVGDMRIAEVNELLDKLSAAQKEENQLPIFEIFYKRMNAEELLWLIRIILRQMKVGATEKTFLDLWHPDGEALFNVSSSLRRVCWELTDPSIRLEGDEAGITLMQCFQPQLAQFQMHSFQKMVDNMCPTEDDTEFWIEEKLDGERMQLHLIEDNTIPGGKRFCFWSRKAKDYTYLYGSGFGDENSALTQHIKGAFDPLVRNLILDGEMITWDPESDIMVPFGTLKTAALSEQRNPYQNTGQRPLLRVFDILYLNDEPLTRYTLRDRRRALERVVKDVHRRLEIHQYESAHSAEAIEPLLRKVVAEASEGLVLKNPRSMYRLNSRNDDWMKVKPEYMTEFGESLDCVVIGGYYGSGHRGGRLSSFLCGLRVDQNQVQKGK